MPRKCKDCPLCGKKNLCKLSNHLADIHRLSSEERRVYLNDVKSSCADEEDHDIMPTSKRARMDNFDEGASTSSDYHNGDIFDSDDEEEKEYNSEEEESSSEENENSEEDGSKEESEENDNSEEDGSKEESEDGDHQTIEDGESSREENENSEEDGSTEESEDGDNQTSEDGGDYDPWQTLIHEAKLQLLDEFQENVECLKNEGFSEVEAKRQSFSALLPKLTKELEDVYIDRLLWMSHMKNDPTHKKIMQTKDNLTDVHFLDRDEALYSAVEKRKFLFKRLLEERQYYSDNESDTNE